MNRRMTVAENQGQQAKATRATTGVANVRYGVYSQPGSYAGQTVAEVRSQLGKMWNIPGDAHAYKGKEQLDGNYVIQPNDQIEFHRKMGEKGI